MKLLWYTFDSERGWVRDDMLRVDKVEAERTFGYGKVPGRTYGISLAPKYLSLTIWTFNQNGERLRSDRFTPTPGSSEQQRYEACCQMIRNIGLYPPPPLP